ncbi:hypothetical protein CCR96_09015 [Halochromatium roseum]|nr:hypothetical protein [Halochromatium roseum]
MPFVDYDGADGPYETVRFCGLKAADFAIVDPSRQVLYLLEVKSAEWFLIDKASDWDAKVCDLFRCFIDSLGICARLTDSQWQDVRDAARTYQVQLVLFAGDHPGDPEAPMIFAETIRRYLRKKLRALDIEPFVLVETLPHQTRELFEARIEDDQRAP